ncbi:uncharacterized protein LOC144662572 [Oculina patagonica]
MAKLFEPLPLEMERSSLHRKEKDVDHALVDYSKLPRSSGDGMEFSSSNSSDGSSSEGSEESDSSQTINNSSLTATVKRQSLGNHVVNASTGKRTNEPQKVFSVNNSSIQSDIQTEQKKEKGSPILVKTTQLEENRQAIKARTKDAQLNSDLHTKPIQRQNSTNLLLQGTELPQLNNQLGLSLSANDQLVSLAPPAMDLGFGDGLPKSTVLEQTAEFIDSQKVINDLEEHNSKLVEEKTKLSVQLGIQTKVNSEIKRLLVASVGEDIGDRLEDLVNRNVQQTVELNHWKKMCEEYSEESDRLEIECDVWRTKFLASRMMSDELSSWKVTLYTRFRQAQSALQRLLDERTQLQQYLTHTKRLVQSLYSMLKSTGGKYQDSTPTSHTSNDQSILEMASKNSSLAKETLDLAQNVLPAFSLAETSLLLAHESQEAREQQQMEPTSAEKLALQVLSSDVELQAEEQQLKGVMKRMAHQYMGHDYQSRFSTRNFRVTYDCCDRCTGTLHVV